MIFVVSNNKYLLHVAMGTETPSCQGGVYLPNQGGVGHIPEKYVVFKLSLTSGECKNLLWEDINPVGGEGAAVKPRMESRGKSLWQPNKI